MNLRWLARSAVLGAVCAQVTASSPQSLPHSALAVRVGTKWVTWWRSDAAPVHYTGATPLAARVRWVTVGRGVDWGELTLAGAGEAWRTRLVLVRLDPRAVRLSLDTAFNGTHAAWTIDRAPRDAVVAVNAGQFLSAMPWGWVVLDGHEFLAASIAPLVSTLSVGTDGAVRLTHARVPSAEGVRWAFQSYPTLIAERDVPEPLRAGGRGVDVSHRDARLALALDPEGRLLIAMTRFDALGPTFARVPFGLTTPEMSAVMGSLGATDAVLLDGGISAQLIVREARGTQHRWPGVRAVPLALIATPGAAP